MKNIWLIEEWCLWYTRISQCYWLVQRKITRTDFFLKKAKKFFKSFTNCKGFLTWRKWVIQTHPQTLTFSEFNHFQLQNLCSPFFYLEALLQTMNHWILGIEFYTGYLLIWRYESYQCKARYPVELCEVLVITNNRSWCNLLIRSSWSQK